MKNQIKSILVLSSAGIIGSAYTPAPKPRPSKEFVQSTYIAPTRYQRWEKSEVRKRQILDNIRALRQETKKLARNRHTTIGYNYGTIAIHSHNLIESILKAKTC